MFLDTKQPDHLADFPATSALFLLGSTTAESVLPRRARLGSVPARGVVHPRTAYVLRGRSGNKGALARWHDQTVSVPRQQTTPFPQKRSTVCRRAERNIKA